MVLTLVMDHGPILDLYARGEPADPITVNEEMNLARQLLLVGGGLYLHTLVNAVPRRPTRYYAQIVAERANLDNVPVGTNPAQIMVHL